MDHRRVREVNIKKLIGVFLTCIVALSCFSYASAEHLEQTYIPIVQQNIIPPNPMNGTIGLQCLQGQGVWFFVESLGTNSILVILRDKEFDIMESKIIEFDYKGGKTYIEWKVDINKQAGWIMWDSLYPVYRVFGGCIPIGTPTSE